MDTVSPIATTKISAFSTEGVSLLHDPDLVEDFSDILRRSDRTHRLGHGKDSGSTREGESQGFEKGEEEEEEEKSNTGSVVITKSTGASGHDRFSIQRASMFSSSSSRYSKSDTEGETKGSTDLTEGLEEEAEEEEESMVTADEDGVNEEKSNTKADTSVRSDATGDVTVTEVDKTNSEDLNGKNNGMEHSSSSSSSSISSSSSSISSNDTEEADEDDATLNLDYSDSEFEESLGTRMQQLNSSEYRRNSNANDESNKTGSKLTPHSSRDMAEMDVDQSSVDQAMEGCDDVFFGGGSDDSSSEELEDEDIDIGAEFQPLPPPTELDPEKLYALYPFNGPDASHCQLEQDEPCVLLNDQDVYWWLVKRCRDNKIGFAPAEILETFPERLARLNCWKNENMSSSSRDLTVINKVPDGLADEEQEQVQERGEGNDNDVGKTRTTSANAGGKHSTLKNYKKSGKSVSFNDIVSYADRYIECSDTDDRASVIEEQDEESEAKHQGDDNNTDVSIVHSNTRHYDEFGEETLHFDDDDNMSETLSETSFSTGFAQPLVLTKRRSAAHRANHDNFKTAGQTHTGGSSRPSSQESNYRASGESEVSEDESAGEPEDKDKIGIDTGNGSEDMQGTEDGRKPWDIMNPKRYVGNKLIPNKIREANEGNGSRHSDGDSDSDSDNDNDDDDDPQKVFEAPVAPFLSKSQMVTSNSQNSVSTLGDFSPSSTEFVAAEFDSPKTNTLLVSSDVVAIPRSPNSLPSSHAIQNITMFLKASRPEETGTQNEEVPRAREPLEQDQDQDQDQEQKTTSKEDNSDTTQISSESNYKVDDTLTKISTQTSMTTVEEFSMDPVMVATATGAGIVVSSSSKFPTMSRVLPPEMSAEEQRHVEVSHIDKYSSSGRYHPVINKIYAPFFSQIDELISRIDSLLQN